MRIPVLSALFSLLASTAFALSCMPHDVAQVYREAAESDTRYFVVLGILTFDKHKLPETDWDNQAQTPPDTRIPARIKGTSLGAGGFQKAFEGQITLNAQCFGPWCSSAISGAQYLAFVNADSLELVVTPCGGYGFANPTQETIERLLRCHRGGACKPVLR